MAWICGQEGIEADAEALAVLAQAGEGSVRDSLSALDQAIACCGNKLDAAQVRALLGAFSLDSLAQVTRRWRAAMARRMLDVVDELERNGAQSAAFLARAGALFSQSAGGEDRRERYAADRGVARRERERAGARSRRHFPKRI